MSRPSRSIRGESIAKLSEGGEPSEGVKAIRPNEQGGLIFDPAAFPALFAGDLPLAEAQAMAADQLPSNPANFADVASVVAWHDKPVSYVVDDPGSGDPARSAALLRRPHECDRHRDRRQPFGPRFESRGRREKSSRPPRSERVVDKHKRR